MNTLMRSVVGGCLMALSIIPAAAQITITAADVGKQLAVGKSVTNWSDTLTKSIDIGTLGQTSWNFSGLRQHTATTLTSVAVSSTPYAAEFPGATHALQGSMFLANVGGLGFDVTATGDQYLILANDLLNPGIKGSSVTGLGTVYMRMAYGPPDTTYRLPSTYNTAWNSNYAEHRLITLASAFGGTVLLDSATTIYSDSYIVDAYGLLTVPGAAPEPALRIHKESRKAGSKKVTFIFLAPSGASVIATAADTLPPASGVINVSAVTWTGPISLGVQNLSTMPREFALQQNYPNPFNPTTTIRFSLSSRVQVTLKVFNLLGEEVATIVDESLDPGEKMIQFNGADLPSGVYLYRLTAGDFVQTRRMVLIR
jgi:hypothetical protein